MTPEHSARLRALTERQRDAVEERAAIIHEAERGRLSRDEADELAWVLEVGGQTTLGGVR